MYATASRYVGSPTRRRPHLSGSARCKSRVCQRSSCRIHTHARCHLDALRTRLGRARESPAHPARAGNGSEDQLLVEGALSLWMEPPIKPASRTPAIFQTVHVGLSKGTMGIGAGGRRYWPEPTMLPIYLGDTAGVMRVPRYELRGPHHDNSDQCKRARLAQLQSPSSSSWRAAPPCVVDRSEDHRGLPGQASRSRLEP